MSFRSDKIFCPFGLPRPLTLNLTVKVTFKVKKVNAKTGIISVMLVVRSTNARCTFWRAALKVAEVVAEVVANFSPAPLCS